MIVLFFLLFSFLKGILTVENSTKRSGIQLWRAQGYLDENVIALFEDRAHYNHETWKRDARTIDFTLLDDEVEDVAEFLDEHNITHTVLMDDVHGAIDEALMNPFPIRRTGIAVNGDSFTWSAYPSLSEIYTYLKKIAATYPSHCKLITIGKTSHRNPIYVLKISDNKRSNRPILVESGMHGREWTGVISSLYFIDSIVRNLDQQPKHIKNIEWHILPVLNPDGYEYSLTTDHLWKKNRRTLSGGCVGVDLNRNFDYNWGVPDTSQWICSPIYAGPVPFSEEETKAFKNLVEGTHFYGYLSIHSAGTKVLFPFRDDPEDHADHFEKTKQMTLAMSKVGNYHFENGDIRKMGKTNNGMSIDWLYFKKQIQNSYIIETRGQNGMDMIPPDQILIAAKEVHAGLMKFAEILFSH